MLSIGDNTSKIPIFQVEGLVSMNPNGSDQPSTILKNKIEIQDSRTTLVQEDPKLLIQKGKLSKTFFEGSFFTNLN